MNRYYMRVKFHTYNGNTELDSGVPKAILFRVRFVGSGKISNPNITSRPLVLLILAIASIQSKSLLDPTPSLSLSIIDGKIGKPKIRR